MGETYSFTKAKFHPVVGKAYGQLPGSLKLLILGESHYPWGGRPEDETKTTAAAMEGVDSHRFWKRLEKLIPAPSGADTLRGWDLVAFYNYVQHIVGAGPRDRPDDGMWVSHQTVAGFREVLEVIKPDRILVVGKVNWRMMAGKDQFPDNPPIIETGFTLPETFCAGLSARSERNAYWYPTGTNSYALCAPIFHPAYPRGFHGDATQAVIDALLTPSWIPPLGGSQSLKPDLSDPSASAGANDVAS